MHNTTYLIIHKDIPFSPTGANGGAEMATRALAEHLARSGENVVLAAQLSEPEVRYNNVDYWDLGVDYNIEAALERARTIGSYHLLCSCRALALLASSGDSYCLSRIYLSHNRDSGEAGIDLSLLGEIADAIVCVSNAHAQEFKQAGLPAEKTIVIHNGVDHSVFLPGNVEIRNYKKLVFAGALVQDKGIHLLVQAFINLKLKYPDITLDVYGCASLWNREAFIDTTQIQNTVPGIIFHGKVPPATIADAYRNAGICVVPSIWFEAFPLTAIEAQVTGCPVVAFDVGGLREGVQHNQTGVIVEEISVEALTRTLDDLISNPETLKQYSREALITARPYFNWQRVADSILQICRKTAETKNMNSSVFIERNPITPVIGFVYDLENEHNADIVAPFAANLAQSLRPYGAQILLRDSKNKDMSSANILNIFYSTDTQWTQKQITEARAANKTVILSAFTHHEKDNYNAAHSFGQLMSDYVSQGQDEQWFESKRPCNDMVSTERKFDLPCSPSDIQALILYGTTTTQSLNIPTFNNKAQSITLGPAQFNKGNVKRFIDQYEVSDFILCVAPFIPEANQLMLLKALEHSDFPLVLVASQNNSTTSFTKAVYSFKRIAPTIIIDELRPSMLASAFDAARVFALPAWVEPTDAFFITAAERNCNIVVSKSSMSADILKPIAFTCNPASEDSIHNAVTAAYYSPPKQIMPEIPFRLTWENTVEETLAFYTQQF